MGSESQEPREHAWTIPLNKGWLFGGPAVKGSSRREFDDTSFEQVALPHTNNIFSWRNIDRCSYEYISIYRCHFSLPSELRDRRIFADFEGVMAVSNVTINGEWLGEYRGGYTPFTFELTHCLDWEGENVLAVEVDSRRTRKNIPPFGGKRLDFDTFGGMYREVSLRVVPKTFIDDVFAKPVDVLYWDRRRLDVRCFLNGATSYDIFSVEAELNDNGTPIAKTRADVPTGAKVTDLILDGLGGIELWDLEHPKLYELAVCLHRNGNPIHSYHTRIGFREAKFEPEGFFLNGRRVKLFGLNRHQLFPYVGGAMPARVQRRDAEILKRELNCNIVRTAHYVQSSHFLDACDELGLLVWNEMPGWQYVGAASWKETATEHVKKMVVRDRNHPSVILWAVRVNESEEDHPDFYDALNRLAHKLDDSRQTTGAYNKNQPLRQDIWGQNDYEFPIGSPSPQPYLISEAVGQKNPEGGFNHSYRRIDPIEIQRLQAKRHAEVHNVAASDDRYAGVIAWLAFDYNSPVDSFHDVKTPGVCDLFRIPKLGASFYQSQRNPSKGIVLEPAFYWDFGPKLPLNGPGEDAMICSNCERLEVYVGGKHFTTVWPNRQRYGNLPYPPFILDLTVNGTARPDLQVDGFVDNRKEISRLFSADTAEDRLVFQADDEELIADGIDATRLVFRAVDRYGAPRPYVDGDVALELNGPGVIVGDKSFAFADAGSAGAVWIRTIEGKVGTIQVCATHPTLGTEKVQIEAKDVTGGR